MSPLIRWFHQLGSPPYFDRFAARWAPWAYALALLTLGIGVYGALSQVPADYQQGDSFRSSTSRAERMDEHGNLRLMALYAASPSSVGSSCADPGMACAPTGAAFTLIPSPRLDLGKPMWGTWWTGPAPDHRTDPAVPLPGVMACTPPSTTAATPRARPVPRHRRRRPVPVTRWSWCVELAAPGQTIRLSANPRCRQHDRAAAWMIVGTKRGSSARYSPAPRRHLRRRPADWVAS